MEETVSSRVGCRNKRTLKARDAWSPIPSLEGRFAASDWDGLAHFGEGPHHSAEVPWHDQAVR